MSGTDSKTVSSVKQKTPVEDVWPNSELADCNLLGKNWKLYYKLLKEKTEREKVTTS